MLKNSKSSLPIPTFEQVEVERNRLKHKKKYMHALRNTVAVLIVVAAIAALVAMLLLPVLEVSGNSMEPTLVDGDIIVLIRKSNYKTGDLCGLYWQNNLLLKRVIALPGSTVDIDIKGNVYVDGVLLDEPYITEKSLGECDIELPYKVPDGKLFIMGDKRATSIDSRSSMVGCIELDRIVGHVLFRAWPFSGFGRVE